MSVFYVAGGTTSGEQHLPCCRLEVVAVEGTKAQGDGSNKPYVCEGQTMRYDLAADRPGNNTGICWGSLILIKGWHQNAKTNREIFVIVPQKAGFRHELFQHTADADTDTGKPKRLFERCVAVDQDAGHWFTACIYVGGGFCTFGFVLPAGNLEICRLVKLASLRGRRHLR